MQNLLFLFVANRASSASLHGVTPTSQKRILEGFFAWTDADDSNVTIYDDGRTALNIVFLELIVQAAMARAKLGMSFKFQSQ